MKLIITENKFKNIIKLSLKDIGIQSTIDNVGGWKNFCKVLKIESPMDFLHLFDDLEKFQSVENEDWTLFRYKKGDNYMIYSRKNGVVYINYHEIWSFFEYKFDLDYTEIQSLTKGWLGKVYNLWGVTTYPIDQSPKFLLDDAYNLK